MLVLHILFDVKIWNYFISIVANFTGRMSLRAPVKIYAVFTNKRAAVAQRLQSSPPTKANRVRFPAGQHPDFRTWESCWTMPLVGGFSRRSQISPALTFRRLSILTYGGFEPAISSSSNELATSEWDVSFRPRISSPISSISGESESRFLLVGNMADAVEFYQSNCIPSFRHETVTTLIRDTIHSSTWELYLSIHMYCRRTKLLQQLYAYLKQVPWLERRQGLFTVSSTLLNALLILTFSPLRILSPYLDVNIAVWHMFNQLFRTEREYAASEYSARQNVITGRSCLLLRLISADTFFECFQDVKNIRSTISQHSGIAKNCLSKRYAECSAYQPTYFDSVFYSPIPELLIVFDVTDYIHDECLTRTVQNMRQLIVNRLRYVVAHHGLRWLPPVTTDLACLIAVRCELYSSGSHRVKVQGERSGERAGHGTGPTSSNPPARILNVQECSDNPVAVSVNKHHACVLCTKDFTPGRRLALSCDGALDAHNTIALIAAMLLPTARRKKISTDRRPLCSAANSFYCALKAVHDKVSTFENNLRTTSLSLLAYFLTRALSDMRPVKLVTVDGRAHECGALSPWCNFPDLVKLRLYEAEEYPGSRTLARLQKRLKATSCGYNSSHPVWHAIYECLQEIHGDSSPLLLQPLHELNNGFWPRLMSPHPAIQFVCVHATTDKHQRS
ncbi:hypothetical protein PR048_000512 [Dryococelus australis]|uniref:Uncharacterized protein n=1 Tax=Dryococelus australis TaxID=614101 RepID=A0ABQ9IET6_9NEOP|nr:hypothetical protein PR048_000512 [Dryococelus australis]